MTTQQPINPPPTTTTTTNPSPPTSTSESEMSLRATTLIANLSAVTARIAAASAKAPQTQPQRPKRPVRLLAVSKIKPASDVQIIHEHDPTLHFGENYFQELLEKSRALSPEVRWHFIGGLQSNKCVSLARDVPGLFAVESVDTEKKANLLNRGWGERLAAAGNADAAADAENRLRVYVQVNTSGEANKSGVEPAEAARLCRHIRENCPRLKLAGLMTIGALARSQATTLGNENEDFLCLRETRDRVEKELGLSGGDGEGEGLELSMGMTQDYEGAIAMGSDQVRVGAEIFGSRPPKLDAKIVDDGRRINE